MTQIESDPPSDLEEVIREEIKEWHFHIYFLQNNKVASSKALKLRDAVLRLRNNGAFVAVPLLRVNEAPVGPHPVGSYEIWCPAESFSSVFSYLCMHRGDLSVLVHPLTRHERKDHEERIAWLGPSFPLNLDILPVYSPNIPLQYPSLGLGYSSNVLQPSLEQRRNAGDQIERTLKGEPEAAPAPEN